MTVVSGSGPASKSVRAARCVAGQSRSPTRSTAGTSSGWNKSTVRSTRGSPNDERSCCGEVSRPPAASQVVAVFGFFVVTLDALVVNVALPCASDLISALIAHRETFVDGMRISLLIAALLLLVTTMASLQLKTQEISR